MKKLLLAVALLFLVSPCFAQALHGHASNVLVLPPNAFFCAPLSENGPAAPIPSCNSGSGTVLTSSATFTTLTIIVQGTVTASHIIVGQIDDFTTGTTYGSSCAIYAGQAACSVTFSTITLPAGDAIAIKFFDGLSGSIGYNVRSIDWVVQ